MTHDEMIAVIAAHRDGKPVQWRHKDDQTWFDCIPGDEPFNFNSYTFRIKPELPKPREWWIRFYPYGNFIFGSLKDSLEHALNSKLVPIEVVHVREVLPSSGEEGK